MSNNVEILIFGKVSDPEAMWDLAQSASGECAQLGAPTVDPEKFAALVDDAARAGKAVKLASYGVKHLFDDVRTGCGKAGLSFVMSYGESGAEGFTNASAWHPGMVNEVEFHLDGKFVTLRFADVQKAARKGIEAVNALLDNVTKHATVGKIEIEPGFEDAYEAFSGNAWRPKAELAPRV